MYECEVQKFWNKSHFTYLHDHPRSPKLLGFRITGEEADTCVTSAARPCVRRYRRNASAFRVYWDRPVIWRATFSELLLLCPGNVVDENFVCKGFVINCRTLWLARVFNRKSRSRFSDAPAVYFHLERMKRVAEQCSPLFSGFSEQLSGSWGTESARAQENPHTHTHRGHNKSQITHVYRSALFMSEFDLIYSSKGIFNARCGVSDLKQRRWWPPGGQRDGPESHARSLTLP